jgi:hypothetical protein
MESVYHIVAIRVNETSWAHVWRLRSRYLRTGYDIKQIPFIFFQSSIYFFLKFLGFMIFNDAINKYAMEKE